MLEYENPARRLGLALFHFIAGQYIADNMYSRLLRRLLFYLAKHYGGVKVFYVSTGSPIEPTHAPQFTQQPSACRPSVRPSHFITFQTNTQSKKFVHPIVIPDLALFSDALLESRCAAAHDFSLANQLGVELGSIKGKINVKIYSVKCSLWGIHSFEIFLQVLAREI